MSISTERQRTEGAVERSLPVRAGAYQQDMVIGCLPCCCECLTSSVDKHSPSLSRTAGPVPFSSSKSTYSVTYIGSKWFFGFNVGVPGSRGSSLEMQLFFSYYLDGSGYGEGQGLYFSSVLLQFSPGFKSSWRQSLPLPNPWASVF